MDGTILDSYDAHAKVWSRILKEHGVTTFTREEIVAQFGKPTPVIASILLKNDDKDFIAAIAARKASFFLEEIPSIRLFPGTREVFEALKRAGKKICIASSSANIAIENVLKKLHLEMLVDAFVGLNDIKNSKPDPEMILKSAAKLGLDPKDCIVVGDTIYDVKAGNGAGCFTIGVLTGNMSLEVLQSAGAGVILPDISKLLDYLL